MTTVNEAKVEPIWKPSEEFLSKIDRLGTKINDYVSYLTNEPSVAFYRVNEHVRNKIPEIVKVKRQTRIVTEETRSVSIDAEYSHVSIKTIKAITHDQTILESLKTLEQMGRHISLLSRTEKKQLRNEIREKSFNMKEKLKKQQEQEKKIDPNKKHENQNKDNDKKNSEETNIQQEEEQLKSVDNDEKKEEKDEDGEEEDNYDDENEDDEDDDEDDDDEEDDDKPLKLGLKPKKF